MYNEEQKRRYIAENPAAEKWFENTEEYEEANGRDLYDFTTPMILEMYKMFMTSSIDRLAMANSVFSRYADWALTNTLIRDGQNHFDEITVPILSNCIDRKATDLITREELAHQVSRLHNGLDKYVFWALFEGLKGNEFCEITSLRWEDIDVKNKTAKLCTGRTVKVSDEFIAAAEMSRNEDTYHAYTENYEDGAAARVVEPERPMTGDVWKIPVKKNVVNTSYSRGKQCYKIIIRCINYLGYPRGYFTAKYLWDSGVMDYIYRLAEEHGIKPLDVMYKHIDELHAQYNFIPQMRNSYKLKYIKYFE